MAEALLELGVARSAFRPLDDLVVDALLTFTAPLLSGFVFFGDLLVGTGCLEDPGTNSVRLMSTDCMSSSSESSGGRSTSSSTISILFTGSSLAMVEALLLFRAGMVGGGGCGEALRLCKSGGPRYPPRLNPARLGVLLPR